MLKPVKGFYANVTALDIQLAAAYYPLLVEMAKEKQSLSYKELVARGKAAYPHRAEVQRAVPINAGRRLDVVRMFTEQRGLPDLTSLVINKNTGECGEGFTRNYDPIATREKVLAFDWSTVSTDFDDFVKAAETSIQPRKKISEEAALKIMAAYYQAHKASLPATVKDQRQKIVELLMAGYSDEEAFKQAASAEV